jgi:ubiquinone/menaquinone biosynthesis C-methylase UbiE
MGLYGRYIFPLISEYTMGGLEDLREATLAEACGNVLEVGFGTGRNLPHYPEEVRRLTALDPVNALRRLTDRRIAAASFPVELVLQPADVALPFEDGEFDVVTMTWTLCTIADPLAALREIWRVLRPRGVLLFLEHGLSENAALARWQVRLTPIQRVLGQGCHLDRRIDVLVEAAGFSMDRLERFVSEGVPGLFASHYRGRASRRG